MFLRSFCTGIFVLLVVVAGAGCRKAATPAERPPVGATNQIAGDRTDQNSGIQNQPSSSPLLRIHWLGKKRLATETNAANFMTIWNLPESGRLEAQTLDKLALWLAGNHPALSNYEDITNYSALVATNTPASALRTLVQDLLQEEWLLEVQQPTNQPAEVAFAIRLDEQRNAAWQAAQSIIANAINGLRHTNCPLTLARSGAWTLLGLSGLPGTNAPLAAFNTQVAASGTPFPASTTNYWLEANADLQELLGSTGARGSSQAPSSETTNSTPKTWRAKTFALPKDFGLPTISLAMIGDGENVRTRAQIDFPQPLNLELDPWNIPTNLIHDPLIGFTAIRGIRPLLKNFKPWDDLQLGTPPNQAYFWGNQGPPQYHFMAIPSIEAGAQVNKLTDLVIGHLDPILAANPLKPGGFVRGPSNEGLRWRGIPLFSPTLDLLGTASNRFIFAGFSTNQPNLRQPIPEGLLGQLYTPTNLCFYDWEITGFCLQGLTPMAQLSRRTFNRPRLPAEPSVAWLLALSQKLGNCGTLIRFEKQTRFSLFRRSEFCLTAAELELLVDWLQSPFFPYGLYTLDTK